MENEKLEIQPVLEKEINMPQVASLGQFSRWLGLSRKTINNWISLELFKNGVTFGKGKARRFNMVRVKYLIENSNGFLKQ